MSHRSNFNQMTFLEKAEFLSSKDGRDNTKNPWGFTSRTMQRHRSIWHKLTRDSKLRLKGSPLADKQMQLKLLSDQTPAKQRKILDVYFGQSANQRSIKELAECLDYGRPMTKGERKAMKLFSLNSMDDIEFDMVVEANLSRILESIGRLARQK